MSINMFHQPKGYYNNWIASICSNFAFYIFYGVFAIFFTDMMHLSETEASIVFGSFMALNWGLTPVAGWLSDSILGPRKSFIYGGFFISLGYYLSSYAAFANTNVVLYTGFASIIIGNSIARINYNKLLSLMYEKEPKLADSGYTLFYASVNVGSFLAFIVGAAIRGGEGSNSVYGTIFLISAIAATAAWLIFIFSGKRWAYVLDKVEKPLSIPKFFVVTICIVIVLFLIKFMLNNRTLSDYIFYIIVIVAFVAYFYVAFFKEEIGSRKRMMIAFVLMIEGVFFYVLYAQMGTSMNFYAINNVKPAYFFGHLIDPIVYQAFNPFWIIVVTPVLASYFNKKSETTNSFTAPGRFAFAMFISGFAFLSLGVPQYFADAQGMFSVGWLALANLLQSTAELMIGALGLSMVIKFTPTRIQGLVFGLWYLTLAIANIIGGKIASLTGMTSKSIPSTDSIVLYGDFFLKFSAAIFIIAILMTIVAPFLVKLGLSSEKN